MRALKRSSVFSPAKKSCAARANRVALLRQAQQPPQRPVDQGITTLFSCLELPTYALARLRNKLPEAQLVSVFYKVYALPQH